MELKLWMWKLTYFVIYSAFLVPPGIFSKAIESAIKECKMYNWKNMTCYWDRYFVDGKEVPITLKFKRSVCRFQHFKDSHIPMERYLDCIKPSLDSLHNICHFLPRDDSQGFYVLPHHLILVSSNKSLVSGSHLCLKDMHNIVQPDPVSSFKVMHIKSDSAEFLWLAPAAKNFTYSISYSSRRNSLFPEINTTSNNLLLTGLVPFTSYHVTIKCIFFNGFTNKGFWSNPTSLEFTTKEDVPSAAPELLSGSFMYLSEDRVKIMWKPVDISLRHGSLDHTRIKSFSYPSESHWFRYKWDGATIEQIMNDTFDIIPDEQIIETASDEVVLDLSFDKDHVVFMDQATRIGFNNSIPLKPIIIRSTKTAFPNIQVENATVNMEGLFQFTWRRIKSALRYTFYWCHANSKINCIEPFEYEVVPGNLSYFEKRLTIANQGIIFASSSEHCEIGCSSGMKFIPCIYNISMPLTKPPQNFHLITSDSSGITVGWNSFSCSPEYPPYFTHYELSYCFLPDHNVVEKRLLPMDAINATIDELSSGKVLELAVRMCSYNNLSSKPALLKALTASHQHQSSELSLFPLPIALITVGLAALVVVFFIFIYLLIMSCEPLKIDIPECKEI